MRSADRCNERCKQSVYAQMSRRVKCQLRHAKRTGKQHADCCVNRTIFLQGKTEHTYMDYFGADRYQPDSHKLAPEKRYPNSAKAAPL